MMKAGVRASPDECALLRSALPAYDVLGVIGRGAYAVVYLAEHRGLGREVAIKRLSQDLLPDADARHRFAAEARVLASLDHPHIVRVYDYVETEAVCALVMERVTGGTLAARMRVGLPTPAAACAIALAVLNGLEHAHQNGVLHRDIKPENLLFGTGDLVKIADFGIAKVIGAQGADLTVTTGTLGTPAYMAPEQIRRGAGELGPATDVWAVGAVLYELLADQPAYARDADTSMAELLIARVNEDARDIREVASQLPEQLCSVVMRALDRAPERRYQTGAQFADALEGAAMQTLGPASLAATAIPIYRAQPAPDGSVTVTEPASTEPVKSALSRRSRRIPARRGLYLLAAPALAAVAAGVLVLSGGGASDPLAGLPPSPPGWPARIALGYYDQVSGPAGVALRTGTGGIASYLYGRGDAAAGKDWSHDHTSPSPYQFATDSQRHGLLPYLDYYELRLLGRNGKPDAGIQEIRKIFNNRKLMRVYWDNVRKFLKQLGATGQPVAVSFESGLWALIEDQLFMSGDSPADVPVIVATAGLPELSGLSDTFPSFAAAWKALRDRYAPHVVLGVLFDVYGVNSIDLRRSVPLASALSSAAKSQARYFLNTAVNGADYVSFEVNPLLSEEGNNPDPSQNYSPSEKAALLAWVRRFASLTTIPVVLEDVPLGNTVMKTIDDKPFHLRDTWVQWLIGDSHFTHLRELRDAGVIGIVFGVTAGKDETCPCDAAHDGITNGGKRGIVSHSADDDGGYLAARLAALRGAGGLDLARES